MEQEYPVRIVTEILKNLPAKTLLRFRCVSKTWCSIIDDPAFIHSHHTRSHTRPGGINLILANDNGHLYSAHPEGGSINRSPDLGLGVHAWYIQNQKLKLHHVNGLIHIDDYICNPSTRQHIKIPPTINFNNLRQGGQGLSIVPEYFLGFDPHTMKYKVLQQCAIVIGALHYDADEDVRVEYKIWTLGTNEWRDIDGPVPRQLLYNNNNNCCKTEHCYVDGVIYIANSSYPLLAFEVGPEKFRLMSLPAKRIGRRRYDKYNGYHLPPSLLEVEGHLALIGSSFKMIRILEDYEKKVWKKQSFGMMYGGKSLIGIEPIGTIHTGEVLLLKCSTRPEAAKLFYRDLESRTLRIAELGEDISVALCTKHVESLVRLKQVENAP